MKKSNDDQFETEVFDAGKLLAKINKVNAEIEKEVKKVSSFIGREAK